MRIWKVVKLIVIRGPSRTCAMARRKLAKCFTEVVSRRRIAESRAACLDNAFDVRWGVETGGECDPTVAMVAGTNWLHGIKYQAVNKDVFLAAVGSLGIQYENYVFVDYGSGKGRAVFLAAGFPFKRVVGIEYCRELDAIARLNLQRYPEEAKVCKHVELICRDAVMYDLPPEPLVLFFYNPFGRRVMEQVVNNVGESFRNYPRAIVIAYLSPEHADLWDRLGVRKRTGPDYTTWVARVEESTQRAQPAR